VRTIAPALAAHYAQRATTIATCWHIVRTDGAVFGFTSHDQDLTVDGVVYAAATGMSRSAISGNADLSVDNLEAHGVFDSDAITDEDLRAGVWDHAAVRVFDVNWADPSMGQVAQLRGWVGEFTVVRSTYTAELRSLAAAFLTPIGELVGPGCTATVGDARCTVDLTDYTATGEVTAVTDARIFATDLPTATVRLTPTSTGTPPDGYFDAGLVTWLTGANTGRRMEVKTSAADGSVELQLPMVDAITPGDTFSVSSGCAKSREVCTAKFGNLVNFRGFPDLPGIDKVMRIGGQ
jgi:uncharacterized phage protein (TIGR02218 family)